MYGQQDFTLMTSTMLHSYGLFILNELMSFVTSILIIYWDNNNNKKNNLI